MHWKSSSCSTNSFCFSKREKIHKNCESKHSATCRHQVKQLICCFWNFNLSNWLTQLHILIKKLITCNNNAFFVCQPALPSHSKAFLCGKLQSTLVKASAINDFYCALKEKNLPQAFRHLWIHQQLNPVFEGSGK